MAKIGLNNFRYGILTEAEDGTPSYNGSHKPAKAVSCSVSITNNSASLYADDALAESDTSFSSGTITMEIDEDDDETMATFLGHQIVDGEMVRNTTDVAPYLGIGRVITKMVNGVYKYKAEFLYKTKFSEPSQENTTKGETMEFATSSLEGTISKLANDDWSATQTFDTKADAIAYIDEKLGGAPVTETYTVTYDVNGGTGTLDPVTVNAGESITLNDGTGITPPTDKTFLGWARTSTSQSATVSSPFTPTADVTLYAVYGNAE
jgi:phi13 family phage major tail protein